MAMGALRPLPTWVQHIQATGGMKPGAPTTIPLPGPAAAPGPTPPAMPQFDMTNTPGFTPGQLTPQAIANQGNLDQANKLAIGNSDAAYGVAQADYGSDTAAATHARDLALRQGAR